MSYASDQSQLLFYEIAMSIGNSLDLRQMLKESLSTYLRKLNCSAGGVFIQKRDADGLFYEPTYTIPRNVRDYPFYTSVSDLVPKRMDKVNHADFLKQLPCYRHPDTSHIHLMELPGFGLLFFVKNENNLASFIVKSLMQLNTKLAKACLACRQNEEIEIVNRRLSDIILCSHDWIWEVDTEGRYTYVSDSVHNLLGYAPKEILGKTCFDIMMPLEAEKLTSVVTDLMRERARIVDLEKWVEAKYGRPVCMLTNGFPIMRKGQFCGYRGIDKDITQWKSAQAELCLAKERAEHASKLKSEFLANMSHEIRTPMNAIIGFTEFLREEPLTDLQQEYLNTIRHSGQNLLLIINDILDLSKIEAGSLDVESVKCSVNHILARVDALLQPKAKHKGLAFRVIQEGTVPKTLKTDPLRLQQCLINLVGNAIKFTDKGHITIHVRFETDTWVDRLRFDIEDTGIGIPVNKQRDIFQAFTQADGSTTRKHGGTGLGLTITKNLAKLLDGELSFVSTVGKGSVFSLVVAARECSFYGSVDEAVEEELEAQAIPEDQAHWSGRILVVEDDRLNQRVIAHILEKLGCTVSIAEHGQEALDKVKEQSFDLVFMDMQMPVMNGYEATRELRLRYETLPIVALTAHAMNEDRDRCLSAGCDDYLSKPINKSQLIGILAAHLKPSKILS